MVKFATPFLPRGRHNVSEVLTDDARVNLRREETEEGEGERAQGAQHRDS